MRDALVVLVAALVVLSGCSEMDAADGGPPSGTLPPTSTTEVPRPAPGPVAAGEDLLPGNARARPSGPPAPPATAPDLPGARYLVTATGELPAGFAAAISAIAGVEAALPVWSGNAMVVETRDTAGTVVDRAPDGYAYGVEVQAMSPERMTSFAPPEVIEVLASLESDEVALGSSSARLRRIGPGGTIVLQDGTVLRVGAVVEDRWVGAAEMVTTAEDPARLGAERFRYALVLHEGPRAAFEEALQQALVAAGGDDLRVVAEGEVPILRHAAVIRSQVEIKLRFGEFAYRPAEGRYIEIDPAWVEANIVTEEVPLLGRVTCHRRFVPLMRAAMQRMEERGQGDEVDPRDFRGCWVARFVTGYPYLSRHAWGIAVDMNFGNPVAGPDSPTNPVLLEEMARVGLTSGHDWITADPGHFEWYGRDA